MDSTCLLELSVKSLLSISSLSANRIVALTHSAMVYRRASSRRCNFFAGPSTRHKAFVLRGKAGELTMSKGIEAAGERCSACPDLCVA